MAELSAKEYWLLKEIEEEFSECCLPIYYTIFYKRDNLLWKKMLKSKWVDIKDLIDFDKDVHQLSYWLSAISIL